MLLALAETQRNMFTVGQECELGMRAAPWGGSVGWQSYTLDARSLPPSRLQGRTERSGAVNDLYREL